MEEYMKEQVEWESINNDSVKDIAIRYAQELRKQFPERKHPTSKAKIPYDAAGDVPLYDNNIGTYDRVLKKYVMRNPITYKENKIWCDAFEIMSFSEHYRGETTVDLRSLIDGRKYHMSISELSRMWNNVHGKIIVGRWVFNKTGKATKVVEYEGISNVYE